MHRSKGTYATAFVRTASDFERETFQRASVDGSPLTAQPRTSRTTRKKFNPKIF